MSDNRKMQITFGLADDGRERVRVEWDHGDGPQSEEIFWEPQSTPDFDNAERQVYEALWKLHRAMRASDLDMARKQANVLVDVASAIRDDLRPRL